MRERLIELIKSVPYGTGTLGEYFNKSYIETCIVEHLLENGVIVPPCKVGDSLYYILEDGEIIMDIVEAIYINQYGDTCSELKIPSYIQGMMCKRLPLESVGQIAFLTKEEAQAAFAERSGGNE